MGPHINAARTHMANIVNASQEKYGNKIFVGFVGYRDKVDTELLVSYPFTLETTEVVEFMNSVSASGGGDIPEAVHEGLEVKKLRGIARST
jgi:hypothetical protein